ncbi:MAG: lipopolysaccharide heptosyltransferase I [Burkholderiaceae bacterium]|nr:lipopolysaccharide heptosyltransferase I [Burkholderiaceae bacterium]
MGTAPTVRILIVKTSSMGDVVHALPLAADIVRARSDATVDWLVEETFASIPAMSRYVANVHRVALRRWRRRPFDAAVWREVRVAKNALRAARYDLVLDVQGLAKSAWISRWTGAPIVGFDSSSAREGIAARFYQRSYGVPRHLHAVERCRQLGALALGYQIADAPQFGIDTGVQASPEEHGAGGAAAVLLVNASRATKLWGDARWLAVEQWLTHRGIASVLFWGSADEQRYTEALASRMQRATVAPRSTLDSIASTLAVAPLVIGLDTGLTHLAAALGRPTVGIYCDYDPALAGLVGDASAGNEVASVGSANEAPTEVEVIAAAERVLAAGANGRE